MAERTAATIRTGVRARVRAEMTEEIKRIARRHLAADGANLSLRAVARDLGVVSSAIYRYFPSRDDLLTALITEAYQGLGEAVETGEAAVDRADLRARWYAVGHSARAWALANPPEYALIYGSPVPGYHAPPETLEPASRVVRILIGILVDGVRADVFPRDERLPKRIRLEMTRISTELPSELPRPVLARGMLAWTGLFGALSFEIFGRLNDMVADREAWFDHELGLLADLVGLPVVPPG